MMVAVSEPAFFDTSPATPSPPDPVIAHDHLEACLSVPILCPLAGRDRSSDLAGVFRDDGGACDGR
jgi:hypothetical protein